MNRSCLGSLGRRGLLAFCLPIGIILVVEDLVPGSTRRLAGCCSAKRAFLVLSVSECTKIIL
jgi:hypothetical protein